MTSVDAPTRAIEQERAQERAALEAGERHKYETLWGGSKYRAHSPAHAAFYDLAALLATLGAARGEQVADMGCGVGRAALLLREREYRVVLTDFAANCLDAEVARAVVRDDGLQFAPCCLWAEVAGELAERAEWAWCVDVLEHIPTALVPAVLANLARARRGAVLQVSTRPDRMGRLVGAPLHLTVRPAQWWAGEAGKYFDLYSVVELPNAVRLGCRPKGSLSALVLSLAAATHTPPQAAHAPAASAPAREGAHA